MALLKYSLIRLALIVPLFVIFMLLQLGAIMSIICATIIAFCLAFLFFRPQRDAASQSLQNALSSEARKERADKRARHSADEDDFVAANPEASVDAAQKPRTRINASE